MKHRSLYTLFTNLMRRKPKEIQNYKTTKTFLIVELSMPEPHLNPSGLYPLVFPTYKLFPFVSKPLREAAESAFQGAFLTSQLLFFLCYCFPINHKLNIQYIWKMSCEIIIVHFFTCLNLKRSVF